MLQPTSPEPGRFSHLVLVCLSIALYTVFGGQLPKAGPLDVGRPR